MIRFSMNQVRSIAFFGFVYFSYYLCRSNISVAKIGMGAELGLDKVNLGLILSLFSFSYAIGQVLHGILVDKFDARKILAYGLLASMLMNLALPWGGFLFIALVWSANGLFQSTGWSACSKSVGKSLEKENRGTGLGLWGIGYQCGGAVAILLAGFIQQEYGWKASFYVPAIILIVPVVMLLVNKGDGKMKNTLAVDAQPTVEISSSAWLRIVVLMVSYMCLGFIRYSFLNWGIEYQNKVLGLQISKSFINLSLMPIGGVAGVVLAGYISDMYCSSKRAGLSFVMMLLLGLMVAVIMLSPPHSSIWFIISLVVIGALVAACDCFIGTTTTYEFSHLQKQGRAIGLVDAFMYVGVISAGYVNGYIIQYHGWFFTQWLWIGVALSGAFVLVPLIKFEKNEDQYVSQAGDPVLAKSN